MSDQWEMLEEWVEKPTPAEKRPVLFGRPSLCKMCHAVKMNLADKVCEDCLTDYNKLRATYEDICRTWPGYRRLQPGEVMARLWMRVKPLLTVARK